MINQKLLTARQEKGWSIEVASARIGVSRVTYSRWENGHQEPQPSVLALLCQAFEKNASELGYAHLSREPRDQYQEQAAHPLHVFRESQLAAFTSLFRQGEVIMFDQKRREMLQTLLAAISLTTVNVQELFHPELWSSILSLKTEQAKANEATVQGLEKLVEACWQFTRGNELALAERLLPECMSRLIPLAQQPSRYQQTAAKLATQGYQIYNILALHKNDMPAKERACKQAVNYSLISGDPNLVVTSLRQLADTYLYSKQYPQMLQTYQKALEYIQKLSPLLQSCVYRGLAMSYVHMNQEQDTLRYLGLAIDTFPDHPESDISYSFADFDRPWLILAEGRTRSDLGQTKQALEVFSRIEQPDIIVPERIRIEIINQRAKTAIISGDLEQSLAYVESGVMGSKILGSQRRYNEARNNYDQMLLTWPQEKRVKELGELFA
jgi:transcriptional regulator with XRE-family HTH domain